VLVSNHTGIEQRVYAVVVVTLLDVLRWLVLNNWLINSIK
jgi:hypothetical protein